MTAPVCAMNIVFPWTFGALYRLTILIIIFTFAQIADAMAYMEKENFIHRNLGARNILVGIQNRVKVAGFGMTRTKDDPDFNFRRGECQCACCIKRCPCLRSHRINLRPVSKTADLRSIINRSVNLGSASMGCLGQRGLVSATELRISRGASLTFMQ